MSRESLAHLPQPTFAQPPRPTVAPVRRWVCVATVLACLPYLFLKVAWVSGLPVGASGTEFTDTTRVANLATVGLEVFAIVVAILFVHPLGRRAPAVVLVLPTWIATGLLTPVVVGATIGAAVQALTGGGNAFVGDDVLAGWVFVAVYAGFAVQAVLLLSGFVLHARDRWPTATGGGRAVDRDRATASVQNLLGGAFVVAASAFAVQQLWWSLRGGGGFEDPATAQRVFLAGGAPLAAVAAGATVSMMRGARLTRLHLALVWVGSAVTFTASLSQTLATLTIEPGGWGDRGATSVEAALTLAVLLGALAGAVGGAFRLAEEEYRPRRTGLDTARPENLSDARPTGLPRR